MPALRAVALAALVAPALAACGGGGEMRTVEIAIRHSRFLPAQVDAAPGETVRFVIVNHDPIAHEFILGNDEVQRRHELGTEPDHGAVPGEASVPATADRATSYTFEGTGPLPFGCHVPGHWGYGMHGIVRVA